MATKNSKAVKAIAEAKEEAQEATAFVIEAADEAMPARKRTVKPSPTRLAAVAAIDAASATLNDGESRPYRVSGEHVDKMVNQLRAVAAERNMSIRTAPSTAAPGALLWQLIDRPPIKRNRTATA